MNNNNNTTPEPELYGGMHVVQQQVSSHEGSPSYDFLETLKAIPRTQKMDWVGLLPASSSRHIHVRTHISSHGRTTINKYLTMVLKHVVVPPSYLSSSSSSLCSKDSPNLRMPTTAYVVFCVCHQEEDKNGPRGSPMIHWLSMRCEMR